MTARSLYYLRNLHMGGGWSTVPVDKYNRVVEELEHLHEIIAQFKLAVAEHQVTNHRRLLQLERKVLTPTSK